jgi:hypothetical protein
MEGVLRPLAPVLVASAVVGAGLALLANWAEPPAAVLLGLYCLLACGAGVWAAALGAGRARGGRDG